MYAQSHRSNASQTNLSLPMDEPFTPPTHRNAQHRMSMPVGAGSFNDLPRQRSRSPLRNSVTFDGHRSVDGSPLPMDGEDPWGRQQGLNSAAKFATNLAQRVGSLMSGPRSPSLMPTDEELEAEAAAERDRTRREAEQILTREAEERRRIAEGVEAMLPPPPSPGGRSRGRSSSPGGGWWKKMIPGKDKDREQQQEQLQQPQYPQQPLTPAQQVILDAHARERQERPRERPRTMSTPSLPPQPSKLPPGGSPARDAPPLYAQFRADGALDVPSTLMTIARRFEKLERWTVGHVRALEERMNDVEKWLVDKERENEGPAKEVPQQDPSTLFQQATVAKDVEELKDDLSELKGRITELGKEMVSMRREASSRPPPVPHPASSPAPALPAPALPPIASSTSLTSPVLSSSALGFTSAFSSGSINSTSSRARNFPTGDYKSSSSSIASPPTSPLGRSPHIRPTTHSLRTPSPLPPPGNERAVSPSATPTTPQPSNGLPAPAANRPPSVSPPRKRYTVALGGGSISQQRDQLQTAYFSSTPSDEPEADDKVTESAGAPGLSRRDSKIGRTAIDLSRLSLSPQARVPDTISNSPSPLASRTRPRPQSAVFAASPTPSYRDRTQSTAATPTPMSANGTARVPHKRSQSIDRYGLGVSLDSPAPGKFVDPLIVRRKETANVASPKPVVPRGGKLAVGQLVAFFDNDKA